MIHRHFATSVLFTSIILSSCKREPEPLADGGAVLRAVRVATSEIRSAEDIAPYDEAMVWQEYRVEKVLEGQLEASLIRVGQWSVIRGDDIPLDREIGAVTELKVRPFDEDDQANLTDVVSSDDLEIVENEPPRFMDMRAITELGLTPRAVRYDYDTGFSSQMTLYWHLRQQMELVVLGNSHAEKAIRPDLLLDEENKRIPKAFNMGIGGGNMDLQCFIANEYVLPLPKVKTIIWVVNARLFNRALKGQERRHKIFLESPGYDFDREHHAEHWPVKEGLAPLTVEEVKNIDVKGARLDPWGWSARERTLKAEDQASLEKDFSKVNFEFDEKAWELFKSTIKVATGKGVSVFVLTSPIHPYSMDAPAADPDGSSHEGMREVVQRLEGFDQEQPLVWFRDMNKNGRHGIKPEQFFDADHLNMSGGTWLTERVIEWMKSADAVAAKPN
ncbi:hypothetical protein FEM03_14745 [Phragmitibacter flavus]|uniref:SGNH/GDSL hydrolase family protein n=1 Tax=Phragmitibacter flavus TaxID=2576071 RepID=A0A5R8KCF6_9BACT|nr:hypothetical protein [Phragmitibacter flavus]TLD69986.1 hypothetical protein FEM03_14745 [Phragmitibacter flavus]